MDIEQHTREIQIESALKTLNEALETQRRGEWQETMDLYQSLGMHDIMISPNSVHNPIIDQLKYLLHRNRGLLQIRRLIGVTDTSPYDIYKSLVKALVDLIRATLYQEPDLKLIEVLSFMFTHLGLSKLARLILEFKVGNIIDSNNQDTELVWDLSTPLEILPDQINLMDDYIKFIDSLGQSSSQLYTHIKSNVNSSTFWDAVTDDDEKDNKLKSIISIDDFNKFRGNDKYSNLVIDVSVNNNDANIDELFNKLLDSMPKHKGRRKFFDGYILTEKPVDSIKFDFHLNDEKDVEVISDTMVIDSNEEDENGDDDEPELDGPTDSILPVEDSVTEVAEQADPEDSIVVEQDLITKNDDLMEASENKEDHGTQTQVTGDIFEDAMESIQPSEQNVEGDAQNSEIQQLDTVNSVKVTTDASAQRLRNTRNKPDVIKQPLIEEMFIQHDTLLTVTIPDYMKKTNLEVTLKPLSPYILNDTGEDSVYSILIESLSDWKPLYSESLTTPVNTQILKRDSDHNSGEELVKEILTYNGSDKSIEKCSTFTELDNGELYNLLKQLNETNPHLYQIRIKILDHLFTLNESNYGTLLTNGKLKARTVNNIKSVLDSVEINLLKSFTKYVNDGVLSHDVLHRINIAISISEILIDSYLECRQSQKAKSSNKNKSRVTELEQIEQALYARINKWIPLIEETFDQCNYIAVEGKSIKNLVGRFNWSKILYLQSSNENINISYLLNELENVITISNNDNLDIKMINFENILPINKHQINIQLSKLKIMDQFSKKGNSNDMLERIFMGNATDKINDEQMKLENEVKKIVNASPFDLKFKLWSSLLKQFISENQFDKAQSSFELVLELIYDVISPETFNGLKKDEKVFTLFKSLGYLNVFCDLIVESIFQNDYKLCERDQNKLHSTLKTLVSFFQLIYTYLIYQDSTVLTHGRKNLASNSLKSFNILNNDVVNICIIFSLYFENSLAVKKNEDINDFLSILHGELGFRKMCSFSNGRFLKFMQHRLVELDWIGSSNDIFQILNCRFGFQITTGDDFEPYDHKCKSKKMEQNDALDLSQFIVSYCHKKKHPIISPPRSDVKTMLDSIIELIGSHDQNDSIIEKNGNAVKTYLNETNLDLQFIMNSFNGSINLPLEVSQNVKFSVVKNGVYYLQAAIALHSYKIRRRNMQSRVAELDYVIKMLQTDLVSGVERLETWLLLGQSFGYLVEDDLIWTADKLNSIEKRKYTAFIQKKSLLCYFMAINIYLKMNDDQKLTVQPIINTLWTSMAFELYNSWFAPLNKLAFHVIPTDASKEIISNGFEMTSSELSMDTQPNDVPRRVIIKILEVAFGKDNNNWLNLMYQAKSKLKLDGQVVDHSVVLETLVSSCQLALNMSNKEDPIIEPHYQLLSSVLKLYEAGKCDKDEFIDYLKLNPLFKSIFESLDIDNIDIYHLAEHILNKIESYDKKKWQHRSIFKLAKIYESKYKDYNGALEQMSKIISLKPTVRNLVTIWKPDHERPGRHFYYCGEYSLFTSELLFKLNDIHSLSTVIKKLRKLASTITNPLKIYDSAMSKLCVLIKRITHISPGLLDLSIQKLKLSEFTETSKELLTIMKEKKFADLSNEEQLALFFLSESQAFKKLSNGFAATGLIDEVFHSLYMLIYYPFVFNQLVAKSKIDLLPIIEGKLYLNGSHPVSIGNDADSSIANLSTVDYEPEGNDSDVSMMKGNELIVDELDVNKLKVLELSNTLSLEDKIKIIWHVTPVKISNLNKEKSRIAKRDISPIAQELITGMSEVMGELKVKFSDPTNLKFDLPLLPNDGIDKLTNGVTFRQSKDFKEETDLQKYAQSHDISLKKEDLESFNSILQSFGINLLENNATQTEQENHRVHQLKKQEDIKKAELAAKKQEKVAMELERQAESAKAFIMSQQKDTAMNSPLPTLQIEISEGQPVALISPSPPISVPPIQNEVVEQIKVDGLPPVIDGQSETSLPIKFQPEVIKEKAEVTTSIISEEDKTGDNGKDNSLIQPVSLEIDHAILEQTIPVADSAPQRVTLIPSHTDESVQQSLDAFVKVKKSPKKRPVSTEISTTKNNSSPKRRRRGRGSGEAPLTMLGDKGKPINLIFTSKEQKAMEEIQLIASSPSPGDESIMEIDL